MIILLMPPEKLSNLCTDYYYAYMYKNEHTILAQSSKLHEAMTKVADPIYVTRWVWKFPKNYIDFHSLTDL